MPLVPIVKELQARKIEEALCRAMRFRQGAEIGSNSVGDRIAHVYDYSIPSPNGGCASVDINLTLLANELERELS